MLYCAEHCAQSYAHMCEQFFNLQVGLDFLCMGPYLFRFTIFMLCLDHFTPVLLAFVVLG